MLSNSACQTASTNRRPRQAYISRQLLSRIAIPTNQLAAVSTLGIALDLHATHRLTVVASRLVPPYGSIYCRNRGSADVPLLRSPHLGALTGIIGQIRPSDIILPASLSVNEIMTTIYTTTWSGDAGIQWTWFSLGEYVGR